MSSRFVYLRAARPSGSLLAQKLPQLGCIVAQGYTTLADPDAVWFELELRAPRTVNEFRSELASLALSDQVDRVDLLTRRGEGQEQARQGEMFQSGPTVPALAPSEQTRPRARRRGASAQRSFEW